MTKMIEIRRINTAYGIRLNHYSNFRINGQAPVQTLPYPELKAEAALQTKFEGNTMTISFNWTLMEEEDTIAIDSTVKTLTEMLVYLYDKMEGVGLGDAFEFELYNEDGSSSFKRNGFLTVTDVSSDAENSIVMNGAITFVVGSSIGIYGLEEISIQEEKERLDGIVDE